MTRAPDSPAPESLGEPIADWTPPPVPAGEVLTGRYAHLEPLEAETHAALLYRAYQGQDQVWDYLPYGPFSSSAQYHRWVADITSDPGHQFFAIRDLDTGTWGGVASYLRINSASGSIEVGHINYSPALQRTRAATEAMYLMMGWAFDNGYRRYEWKCNALNLPSRRAAQRLGFSYEGVFRHHTVTKGRNRDTAWFSVIDDEWPALKVAFEAWCDPSNFDSEGNQSERLSDLTRLTGTAADPALVQPRD